jgi:shikimate kinase
LTAELCAKLQGLNLYLVGMMGVGKSTIGQLLGERLGYQFFDTDTLIENLAHQSIPQIFATQGEMAFREIESRVLAELSSYKNLVVATGGGVVLRRENWSHLQHGLVIWLDVPIEDLYARLEGDDNRPLLQTPDPKGTLAALLQQRRPLYTEADLHLIPAPGETPEQTVDRVLGAIPSVLKVPDLEP